MGDESEMIFYTARYNVVTNAPSFQHAEAE